MSKKIYLKLYTWKNILLNFKKNYKLQKDWNKKILK
jgi:hypothetical protein